VRWAIRTYEERFSTIMKFSVRGTSADCLVALLSPECTRRQAGRATKEPSLRQKKKQRLSSAEH
jgi:hypothetical protein